MATKKSAASRSKPKPKAGTYRALCGLSLGTNRAEPGDTVDWIPAADVDHLIGRGAIEPVGGSSANDDDDDESDD